MKHFSVCENRVNRGANILRNYKLFNFQNCIPLGFLHLEIIRSPIGSLNIETVHRYEGALFILRWGVADLEKTFYRKKSLRISWFINLSKRGPHASCKKRLAVNEIIKIDASVFRAWDDFPSTICWYWIWREGCGKVQHYLKFLIQRRERLNCVHGVMPFLWKEAHV